MLEDVIEGISSGDVDFSRFEGHAMLDRAHRDPGSDGRRRGRLALQRLLLLMAEKRVKLGPVDVPPELKEGGDVVVVAYGSHFPTEFIIGVMPWFQRAQEMADFDVLSKFLKGGQIRIGDVCSHVVDERKTMRRRTYGPGGKVGVQKTLITSIEGALGFGHLDEPLEGLH